MWIESQQFLHIKMYFVMSSAKWRSFCLVLNVSPWSVSKRALGYSWLWMKYIYISKSLSNKILASPLWPSSGSGFFFYPCDVFQKYSPLHIETWIRRLRFRKRHFEMDILGKRNTTQLTDAYMRHPSAMVNMYPGQKQHRVLWNVVMTLTTTYIFLLYNKDESFSHEYVKAIHYL